MPKKKFSIQEKREYCLALEKSGLSSTQFCKTIGISASALRKWRIQFRKSGTEGGFSPLIISGPSSLVKQDYQIEIAIHLACQMQICLKLHEKRLVPFIQELSDAASTLR